MQHTDTAPDGKSKDWITSLVEYLKEGDLSILRHENHMPPRAVSVHGMLELNDKQCSLIWAKGVRVIGDLVRTTAYVSNWSLPRTLNKANRLANWLKKLLPKEVPLGAITIEECVGDWNHSLMNS